MIRQLLHLSPQPFDKAAQGCKANQTPWQPLPQQREAVPLSSQKASSVVLKVSVHGT